MKKIPVFKKNGQKIVFVGVVSPAVRGQSKKGNGHGDRAFARSPSHGNVGNTAGLLKSAALAAGGKFRSWCKFDRGKEHDSRRKVVRSRFLRRLRRSKHLDLSPESEDPAGVFLSGFELEIE